MKILTCYIVDDEYKSIELLSRFIESTPGLTISGTSEDPLEALPLITARPPDLTFLDVQMPQLSGLDLFGMISLRTHVIFTTAFATYAVDAFDLQAPDFLLKPFSYERFLKAVNRARTAILPVEQQERPDFFFIKSEVKGKIIRVSFSEILYLEAAQNYVFIHTPGAKHVTYLTLKEMEEALPEGRFVRIHKSTIVHIEKIRSVEGGAVILCDGTLVLIGNFYRDQFLELVAERAIFSKRLSGS